MTGQGRIMRARRGQSGFTLLELLLSIGLLAMLLAGAYQLFDIWTQRAVNRNAAAEMMRVQIAAQDYVLANFDTFKNDAPAVFVELNIANLRNNGYLPTGYQARNAFRQTMRVFRRNIATIRINPDGTTATDASGNPIRIITIEVVTVSDNPPTGTLRVPNKRLLDTAQAGGPKMGVISEIVLPGSSFSGLVTSVFGEWYFARTALSPAGYNATPDSIGGYLAAYGLVSNEATDANDYWLYRVTVEGRPELNRMAADLIMNSNPLENVGTMVADRITVVGDATFRGIGQGVTAETAQALTVEQALRIDGTGESRINMKDVNGTCSFVPAGNNRTLSGNGCAIAGGEVQVIAENRVDPVTGAMLAVAGDAVMNLGTLLADGSVITDFTNVVNTTTSDGVSTFNTAGGQDMQATKTVLAPTVNISGGTVDTRQMQAGGMTLSNGASVRDQLVAARATPNGSNTFTAQTLQVGNAAEFSGNLIAQGARATDTLFLDNATDGYYDSVVGQTVWCTPHSNGRTYCEPYGRTYWNGNQFFTDCEITGSGYRCYHYRNVGYWQYYGVCNFTRATGAVGQALHHSSCSPA